MQLYFSVNFSLIFFFSSSSWFRSFHRSIVSSFVLSFTFFFLFLFLLQVHGKSQHTFALRCAAVHLLSFIIRRVSLLKDKSWAHKIVRLLQLLYCWQTLLLKYFLFRCFFLLFILRMSVSSFFLSLFYFFFCISFCVNVLFLRLAFMPSFCFYKWFFQLQPV